MKLSSVHSRLSRLVKAWDRSPNSASYYLDRITEVVNQANEVKQRKVERKKRRIAKNIARLLTK